MRLTVFGGTSPTGQQLIQKALQIGHTVTALARNPARLAARDGLTVIEGQLTDTQAIARAVADAETVISLLGPPSKPALGRVDAAPILDGYRNIVAAMETHGVRRLVALGTPSITDPADRTELAFSILVAVGKRIRPAAYRAMVGIGQIVRASDLDWTIVHVPLLTDGPLTELINVRTVGDKGGIRLSRANAAAYLLQQAEDTSRVGQAPLITDTKTSRRARSRRSSHRDPARSRPAQRRAPSTPPTHTHTWSFVMRALNVPAAGQQPEVSKLPIPAPTEGTVLIKVKGGVLERH